MPQDQPIYLDPDDKCIVCGRPNRVGDHSHANMRFDDTLGLMDDNGSVSIAPQIREL